MRQGDWCILRTSAARTLALATSLAEAGFEVWTPVQLHRRTGRGKARHDRVEVPAPITPTFVFARATHLLDLAREVAAPVSDHPRFSILRFRERIPLVSDTSLAPLREEEERQHRRHVRTIRKAIAPGTSVRMEAGAFAGMTGIVERGNGREAVVNFGRGFVVSIATYLIDSDVLSGPGKPRVGIAA